MAYENNVSLFYKTFFLPIYGSVYVVQNDKRLCSQTSYRKIHLYSTDICTNVCIYVYMNVIVYYVHA